jgi:hypothetical protein
VIDIINKYEIFNCIYFDLFAFKLWFSNYPKGIPHLTRYGLITICKNNFMSTNTENTPTENNSRISRFEEEEISHYEKLIKKLFYSCEKCDGALVQLATCIVCKRTVLRICVSCHIVSDVYHTPCKITSSQCFEDSAMKN